MVWSDACHIKYVYILSPISSSLALLLSSSSLLLLLLLLLLLCYYYYYYYYYYHYHLIQIQQASLSYTFADTIVILDIPDFIRESNAGTLMSIVIKMVSPDEH